MEEPAAEKRSVSATADDNAKPSTNHRTASPAPSAGAAAEPDAATQAAALAEREVAAAKAAAEQQQKRREASPQQDRPQAPTPPAEPRLHQESQEGREARSYERSTSKPLVQSPEREQNEGEEEPSPRQQRPNGTATDSV